MHTHTHKQTKEKKGLDIVRRDWCQLARRVGDKILDFILAGDPVLSPPLTHDLVLSPPLDHTHRRPVPLSSP